MNTETNNERLLLSGMLPEEISESLGLKPFQGRILFRWIQQRHEFDFEAMTDLSKALRAELPERAMAGTLKFQNLSESSATGTQKALLALPDDETVEAVHIPAKERTTFCISSQVGCPVKCSFCATGLSGYSRNLSAGEIVEQVLYLANFSQLGKRTPNIVYMGMGEPFYNYDAVLKSMKILMHREGMNIGARRITVSTSGDVSGIDRFSEEDWQVRLSISLHSANDAKRDVLVPLNRKYPLAKLNEAIDRYLNQSGRQITFEWALLSGENDGLDDARELVDYIGGRNIHVNLIPYNPVQGAPYQPPNQRICKVFREELAKCGVNATLRLERGQDINAACGQLRRQSVASAVGTS